MNAATRPHVVPPQAIPAPKRAWILVALALAATAALYGAAVGMLWLLGGLS